MKLSKIVFFSALILLPTAVFAGDGNNGHHHGGGNSGNGGGNGGGGGVPLDGGLSLLVASGVGYGVKKISAARKKNKAEMTK